MSYAIGPDADGNGLVTLGVAGELLSKYDLVSNRGAKWYRADRNTSPTLPAYGMALSDLPKGYRGRILLYGLVSNPDWNWKDGAIYASSILGGLTQEPPEWSFWVQSIGVAYGTDYMLFAPMWVKNLDASPVMTIVQDEKHKVISIYVELLEGSPRLRVEYEVLD